MGDEVKVFGFWGSPFSRRVELALRFKGIPYEYIEEDVIGNKSPLLLQYNPVHKKVPVLLHNGKPIAESLVILEYIDETWKSNPILPEDPYNKAKARFWAKFIDDKCMPAIQKAVLGPEKEREQAAEEVYDCLKALESELNGKRFFGGDTIGMVDIAGNFVGYWLRIIQEVTGVELLSAEKFPHLFKWTDEFVSCSIVGENLHPKDKVSVVIKARIDQMREAQTKAPN
ncbi:putative glutathione S-transferase [Hibiscus syriacus]|uniref:glutathione transferase n=1 Tax=Hibiscus syriacus TaxID=106335 RepID=A0A6A2WX18_HIBSY|nr:glutathione S-transferase U8-like [Hibiscus syriacus]KAE8654286.1 putative glutathione S-transferase [Hibiscus syriacus]